MIINSHAQPNDSMFQYGQPTAPKMVPCTFSGCRICPYVNIENFVTAYATRKRFGVVRNEELSCQATNVVYIISCNKCGKQYVGETKRTLRMRMNEHRNKISNKSATTFLVNHFTQDDHTITDMRFAILEKLPADTTTEKRLEREDFWIRALNTAFPFGLNDKIAKYGLISKGVDPMNHKNHPYFSLKFPLRSKSHGSKTRRSNRKLNLEVIQHAEQTLMDDSDTREVYLMIQRLSKKHLHHLYHKYKAGDIELNQEKALILTAMASYRLGNNKRVQPHRTKLLLTANFPNKGMEFIEFHTIFKDRRIHKHIKASDGESADVMVAYKYQPSIGEKFLNHCKMLKQLDTDKLRLILGSSCSCSQSAFSYKPAGHIITGDLTIIRDAKLKEIFEKGTKFRIPTELDWQDVRLACHEALDLLRKKLIKFKVPWEDVNQCLEKCLELTTKRIEYHQQHQNQDSQPWMEYRQWKALKSLQKDFVIAPADKASGNFIIICKKYFVETLCTEMGVMKDQTGKFIAVGNTVYQPAHNSFDQLISEHQDYTDLFGLNFKEEDNVLPVIFPVPKLHKIPYKFRFIAGARKSSMKPISLCLTRILTFMKEHFRNYCLAMEVFSGTKSYWSIDSSLAVLQKLQTIRRPRTITTADFSNLYTSIPHDLILQHIRTLINLLFGNAKKTFLCVGYKNCFYSNEAAPKYLSFTNEEVYLMVRIVLENTYVTFSGFIFRQISGVPMGGNASPMLADLTLSMLEFQFFKKASPLEKQSMGESLRYIDDILNINGKQFLDTCNKMYPDCLSLEDTTTSNSESNFLDLTICLEDRKIKTSLYNKTDAFNFVVNRLPNANSNIHSNTGYNTFYTQLIRMARICSHQVDFEIHFYQLCHVFITKGFNKRKLLQSCKQFANNYQCLVFSLGLSKPQFMSLIKHKLL